MSSSLLSALVLRWPGAVDRRRFWSVTSGVAVVSGATLLAVLDGLLSAGVPTGPRLERTAVPGFALTRGAGYLSRGAIFALHVAPEGARLVPACPAGRCRPIHLRLVGGRTGLRPRAQDPLPVITPARLFASVVYDDVYPGIALRFRGHGEDLSYAFLVDRGASPQSIVLALDGVEHIVETPGGGLVASSAGGASLVLSPPTAEQDGVVEVRYAVRAPPQVALEVGLYDVRRPLTLGVERAALHDPHR